MYSRNRGEKLPLHPHRPTIHDHQVRLICPGGFQQYPLPEIPDLLERQRQKPRPEQILTLLRETWDLDAIDP
jgi:hypothetical protein